MPHLRPYAASAQAETGSPDPAEGSDGSDSPPPAPRRRWWPRVLAAGALVTVAAVGAAGAGLAWLWQNTPDAAHVMAVVRDNPSRIVAADGTLLDIVGATAAQPVTLQQVSPFVVQALLATEDRRFHDHHGIDPVRLVSAAWRSAHGDLQGGSTLTQQLARNLFPRRIGNERSLGRKLREAVVALKIEQAFSKDEILTMYLNRVPFLYGVTGVEMASRTYFDKPASALHAHEAAMLVALLKGPGYYDPQRRPERAKARRDLVLALMAREGALPVAVARAEQARPLTVSLRRHDGDPQMAPHYVQYVRRQAQDWADAHGHDLARDGLTIHTTLEPRVQQLAEAAVREQGAFLQQQMQKAWTPSRKGAAPWDDLWRQRPDLWRDVQAQTVAYRGATGDGGDVPAASRVAPNDAAALQAAIDSRTRLEAALVALDPRNGRVRAWVGARDPRVERYDHVAQAQRQPGSTFKPFVYAAALRAGLTPWQTFVDAAPTITLPDGRTWTPGDVGGSSGETMTLRTALAKSKNTITAQVVQRVGAPQVAQMARELGITQAALDEVPSLGLGTSPVSLLEMVRAYGTLADGGVRREPVVIERIVDAQGVELAHFGSDPTTALDTATTVQLVDMMRGVVRQGTATRLRTQFGLTHDLAGKTGTTQNNADGWFIAMQPDLVVGAWVGYNDPRVTLRSREHGHGGQNALLLVGQFLKSALQASLVDASLRFPNPPPDPPPEPAAEPGLSPSPDAAPADPALLAAYTPAPVVPVALAAPAAERAPAAATATLPLAVPVMAPPVTPGAVRPEDTALFRAAPPLHAGAAAG